MGLKEPSQCETGSAKGCGAVGQPGNLEERRAWSWTAKVFAREPCKITATPTKNSGHLATRSFDFRISSPLFSH